MTRSNAANVEIKIQIQFYTGKMSIFVWTAIVG